MRKFRTRLRRAAHLALVLACVVGPLNGCTSARGGGSATGGGGQGSGSAKAVASYGYGPSHDASIAYQPDVVLIGGGPDAIRAVSGNGLTWTIDGSAAGARDLAVGKVMFASSHAVGRVVALRTVGSNVVATLAPVNLTDLLRHGSLNINQSIDPAALQVHRYPDLPGGALSTPSAVPGQSATPSAYRGGATIYLTRGGSTRPETVTVPALYASPGGLTAQDKGELKIGNWLFRPALDSSKIGLGVVYNQNAVRLGITLQLTHGDLHLRTSGDIGSQVPGSGIVVTGITGLHVAFAAGLGGTTSDNVKIRVEIPETFEAQLPPSPQTAGLPMVVQVSFKLIVETALAGRNSTVTASGDYGFSGDLAVDPSGPRIPSLSVKHSLIDSIAGITLAPSGVVASFETKFGVGLGLPGITAGPYAAVVDSVGITNGSVLGSPLARCHGASLDIRAGGGLRAAVTPAVSDILKALLPKDTKLEYGLEVLYPIIHRQQTVPDVPLCR